jgi:hypothetical protein
LGDAAKGVIKSPLVLSAAAGIAFSLLGWTPPVALGTFCDILGAAAPPSALFAIGLFMAGRSVTAGAAETSWLVFFKLLVQPAITALIAYGLLDMAPLWSASAITLAALPRARWYSCWRSDGIFPARDGGDPGVDHPIGGDAIGAVHGLSWNNGRRKSLARGPPR